MGGPEILITKNLSEVFKNGNDVAYAQSSGAILEFESVLTGLEVKFPAFLTDFSQTFNSSWQTEDVFGRMDPIATFQNTKRTLSLAWEVPAGSLKRAKTNLQQYSLLAQMLYPGYNTDNAGTKEPAYAQTMARPPLIKLKFANLIGDSKDSGGLLGFIDNLSMKPALDMGFFSEKQNLYPKVFSLSFGFTVIHQHDVGFGTDQTWQGGDEFPF